MKPEAFSKRINSFINITESGCWEWMRARFPTGYGCVKIDKKSRRAHRVSYEVFNGPLDGLMVLHHCDNPPCINPSHLYLGDQKKNAADRLHRGREKGPAAVNRAKTHCKRGHKLSPENVYIYKGLSGNGLRSCRKCMAMHNNRYRNRKTKK